MTLEKFHILSKAILCLTFAVVLLITPFLINYQLTALRNDATIQLNAIRSDSTTLIDDQTRHTRELITSLFDKTNARVGSLETKTFLLANNLRKDSVTLADNINKNSFGQITTLNAHLDNQMTALNQNLDNHFGVLSGSVSKVADAYAGIPARFDRQTDCEKNGLCWQNLTTDLLTNFRFTGRDISASTKVFNDGFPVILTGVQTSVTNFASITSNINRLTTPKWYDRLLGYGLNGVMIYRNLNPATNIVVRGTQFITAH
jgi:hypothetical protein